MQSDRSEATRSPLQELQAIGVDTIIESKQRLELQAAILERLPDAKVVVDQEGKIVLVNAQTEFMFGYHRTELIGQKVEMLLPTQAREIHVKHRSSYNDEPRIRSMDANPSLMGRRKNGKEFPIDIMLAPIVISWGSFTIAVIRRKPAMERSQQEKDGAKR
jgi:PAS domain S-box-containing protein